MRNDLYMDVGKRIRKEREKAGYSREQLAELVEISSRFLADIELGTKGMSFSTLIRLSHALHTSIDYLLVGQETAPDAHLLQLLADIDSTFYPELETILQSYCKSIEKAKQGL